MKYHITASKCAVLTNYSKLYTIKKDKLLEKINFITDWDLCEAENEELLKSKKESKLSPGDVIKWEDQIIGVPSKDSVLLIISETGYHALDRFVEVVDIIYKARSINDFFLVDSVSFIENPILEEDLIVLNFNNDYYLIKDLISKFKKEGILSLSVKCKTGLTINIHTISNRFYYSSSYLLDEDDRQYFSELAYEAVGWLLKNKK